MFKRNFAVLITTVLLSAAGAVQAAASSPSAAPEGSEFSANYMLPATVIGLSGANSVFPSAALEGSESATQYIQASTPRNLDRSYAETQTSVFPNSAME